MAEAITNIPTPPATPPAPTASPASLTTIPVLSASPVSSDLVSHIDELLETYLHNLDQYTQLREQLSKQLSNGFLSLAHANRTTTTGRRYGEECYDERMKAGRRVKLEAATQSENGDTVRKQERTAQKDDRSDISAVVDKFEVISLYSTKPLNPEKPEDDTQADSKTSTPSPPPNQPDPSSRNSTPTDGKSSEPPQKPTQSRAPSQTPAPKLRDPILQFGILTPPSLRLAQTSFTTALSTTIPELLNTNRRMEWLEHEIGRIRSLLVDKGQEEEENKDGDDSTAEKPSHRDEKERNDDTDPTTTTTDNKDNPTTQSYAEKWQGTTRKLGDL